MHYLLTNWKTTALGAGAFCTALGALLTSLASGDTTHLFAEISAVMTAVGIIFAKDGNVTGGTKHQ